MKRKTAPKRQTAAAVVRRHDAEVVSIVTDTEANPPRLHCTLRMTDGSEMVVSLKTLDLDRNGTSLDPSGVSLVNNLRGVNSK